MSAFGTMIPQFGAFLWRAKDDRALAPGRSGTPQNARFIPRNFLIEERLDPSRAASYAADLPAAGPVDFAEWNRAHNAYLKQRVFVTPPAAHDHRLVALDNPAVCPE